MNIKLRDCTLTDLELLLDLKRLCLRKYIEIHYGWDEEIQKQKTQKELANNLSNMKVITLDGIDIGITTFFEYEDYCQVGLLIIHPDYQNKGIATSIINDYIKYARENKKRIIIKTNIENPARKLYERLGFTIYETDNTHVYLEIKAE